MLVKQLIFAVFAAATAICVFLAFIAFQGFSGYCAPPIQYFTTCIVAFTWTDTLKTLLVLSVILFGITTAIGVYIDKNHK